MRKAPTYCFFFTILMCGLSGCTDQERQTTQMPTQPAQSAFPESPAITLTPRQSQMWARSCALCHVDGNAGAPRLGDTEDWQTRLTKGYDTLLQHTIDGFNDMPPLGYCMACEAHDFSAMIRFMSITAELSE